MTKFKLKQLIKEVIKKQLLLESKDYERIAQSLSTNEIEQMRDWLKDCSWSNMEEEDFDNLSNMMVVKAIVKYYDDGLRGWWRDSE